MFLICTHIHHSTEQVIFSATRDWRLAFCPWGSGKYCEKEELIRQMKHRSHNQSLNHLAGRGAIIHPESGVLVLIEGYFCLKGVFNLLIQAFILSINNLLIEESRR